MYNAVDANKRKSVFLIVLFVLLLGVVGWIIGEVTGSGYGGILLALILATVMTLVSYFQGDRIALGLSGARMVTREQAPELVRIIENLSITAGIPQPRVAIIEDDAMNAFATGRDPKHATVAVTTGLLSRLQRPELEGVLAHELSHVKNYDVRLMMIVLVLAGSIAMLTHGFFRFSMLGGRSNRRSGGGILMLVGIIALILAPLAAQLIKLAVSRKREFLADAGGALLTRYPDGLAAALEKIGRAGQPLRRSNEATAHLFFASPFGAKARGLTKLFSTHPPIEERVGALRRMGQQK